MINHALVDVYSGVTPPDGIDPSLWKITYQELNKAVDEGFGVVQFGDPDFDFVQELKYNNAVFSAFKSHNQSKELAAQLLDEDSKLKSFSRFRKDTESIIGDYNVRWLKTERTTAIKSARNAANWRKWEKTKDLYPNIEYLPSRAAVPRPEHKVFYGTVLPMDDPFWASHTPPLDWGCLCGVTNSDKERTDVPVTDVEPAPGLDNNPAISKRLFSSSHPYQSKVKKKAHKTVTGATERLMRNSIRLWANETLVKGNAQIVRQELKYPITFTNEQVRVITGKAHPNRAYRDMLLTDIEDVMKQAELLKAEPVTDAVVKTKEWYYYKVNIQGEESYINVFVDSRNEVSRIHAISAFSPVKE